MSMRHTAIRGRRAVAAVALAAVTALTLAGCSGGGDTDDKGSSKPSNAPGKADGGKGDDGTAPDESAEPEATETLAEVKGEGDITLTITDAIRDSGGFVTLKGTITNKSDEVFTGTARWVGTEQEVTRSGSSVAGAVLVDQVGKKRYYVLRDTEGRCLCTMGITSIDAKESVPFFAQFPAPPEKVTKVEFQLPTMPPAQIELSR